MSKISVELVRLVNKMGGNCPPDADIDDALRYLCGCQFGGHTINFASSDVTAGSNNDYVLNADYNSLVDALSDGNTVWLSIGDGENKNTGLVISWHMNSGELSMVANISGMDTVFRVNSNT